MIDRHIRKAGVRLIEAALSKVALAEPVSAPTLATLKAQKTRELKTPATATAVVPKVLTLPTS